MRASDIIDNLNPEKEIPERNANVSQNPRLEKLVADFGKLQDLAVEKIILNEESNIPFSSRLYRACSIITPEQFYAREIQEFLIEMSRKPTDNFCDVRGMYLSWLVNNSPDNEFRFNVRNLDQPLDNVGYVMKEGKVLELVGDVGRRCGEAMQGGILRIHGSADRRAGHLMRAGLLEIDGNTGDLLSQNLYGGKVVVKGNALGDVGNTMFGGEVHIYNCKNSVRPR